MYLCKKVAVGDVWPEEVFLLTIKQQNVSLEYNIDRKIKRKRKLEKHMQPDFLLIGQSPQSITIFFSV